MPTSILNLKNYVPNTTLSKLVFIFMFFTFKFLLLLLLHLFPNRKLRVIILLCQSTFLYNTKLYFFFLKREREDEGQYTQGIQEKEQERKRTKALHQQLTSQPSKNSTSLPNTGQKNGTAPKNSQPNIALIKILVFLNFHIYPKMECEAALKMIIVIPCFDPHAQKN